MGPLDLLDDGCVLQIMRHLDPSPDIFTLARVCLRFKRLAHDSRNWLVVCPSSSLPHPPWQSRLGQLNLNAANVYRSLQSAVSASRPGDTILLLPGTHLTSCVVLDKPLALQSLPPQEDSALLNAVCVLTSTVKGEAALDVRATCRVSGLCIRSHCGPCVLHRSGQLHLERCQLTCDAHGLEHLCAPIVTRARSAKTPLRPQRALSATVGTPAASATTPENSPLAQGGSQGGKLAVSECLLEGGSRAISCEGSGALQSVRVIYHARRTVFWLTVDSSYDAAAAAAAARAGAAAAVAALRGSPVADSQAPVTTLSHQEQAPLQPKTAELQATQQCIQQSAAELHPAPAATGVAKSDLQPGQPQGPAQSDSQLHLPLDRRRDHMSSLVSADTQPVPPATTDQGPSMAIHHTIHSDGHMAICEQQHSQGLVSPDRVVSGADSVSGSRSGVVMGRGISGGIQGLLRLLSDANTAGAFHEHFQQGGAGAAAAAAGGSARAAVDSDACDVIKARLERSREGLGASRACVLDGPDATGGCHDHVNKRTRLE